MAPIRFTQLLHLAHYLVQGLLMAGVVWKMAPGIPGRAGQSPILWPYVLLAFLLILMVGSSLYTLSRYLRPELRRPIRENRRVYRSRQLLHNSLLELLALPPLLFFAASRQPQDLAYFGLLTVALAVLTWPTQRRYHRWLLSAERRLR